MKYIILYKNKTSKGANYFKLMVEIANGIWEDAVYFGSTVPRMITSLKPYKNGWTAQIQQHISRDQMTGRYKCKRKVA